MSDHETNNTVELSELLQIRRDKLAAAVAAGKNPFEQTSYPVDAYAAEIVDSFNDEDEAVRTVKIAGRITAKRDMGKASFADLTDSSGRIQLYIKKDVLGEELYADFLKCDIGDIVGVEGDVFRTRKGEISVSVTSATFLAKALLPLPEKWHGLKDTELRYRQRYVDLIANPEVKNTFILRSKIIREMRNLLDEQGFIEVETPVLQTEAGGAAARPFLTRHNALNIPMSMRIALELHLKRLIVGGFDKVYEIGRVFRNEGISPKHNPEFTLLELYQAYTDYEGMMRLCEGVMRGVAKRVLGTAKVSLDGNEIDLEKPFARITMTEAVKRYSDVDFDTLDTEQALKLAKERGMETMPHHGWGDVLNMFFERYAEEELVQPTFLTHHPVEISPLSKKCPEDGRYTERFELFIGGREYANAFSELNDPIDQRERFEAQLRAKAAGDDEAAPLDEDFLNALSYGMPPTGGIGIGIDRFVMLLTGSSSIRDVLLFPTMRPLN